jgi:hypothetical protein
LPAPCAGLSGQCRCWMCRSAHRASVTGWRTSSATPCGRATVTTSPAARASKDRISLISRNRRSFILFGYRSRTIDDSSTFFPAGQGWEIRPGHHHWPRNALIASLAFGALKTPVPATSTFAPDSREINAVSAWMPPSTSI